MESGDRRLEPVLEFWVAVNGLDGFEQRLREERIMGNVYAKAGSEQGVVHRAFRAIVQGEKQLVALGNCRGHHTRGGNANGLTPRESHAAPAGRMARFPQRS